MAETYERSFQVVRTELDRVHPFLAHLRDQKEIKAAAHGNTEGLREEVAVAFRALHEAVRGVPRGDLMMLAEGANREIGDNFADHTGFIGGSTLPMEVREQLFHHHFFQGLLVEVEAGQATPSI